MKLCRQPLQKSAAVVLALHFAGDVSGYRFSACEDKVRRILNGTYDENGINNATIHTLGYVYDGPLQRLKPGCPRSEVLSLTMEGCRILCNDPVEITEPANALSLTATWVFPLAIIFNLPYEAYHSGRKVFHTLKAVLNWLGSPQSALAATLWNFSQIRRCSQRAKAKKRLTDVMYVLSCLNQFDLLEHVPRRRDTQKKGKGKEPASDSQGDSASGGTSGGVVSDLEAGNVTKDENLFFKVLIYGLFRPQAYIHPNLEVQLSIDTGNGRPIDMVLTEELLVTLAYQLRMLRRRGVIPILGSLVVFLVAFVFSVVLTFGEFGDNINVIYMSIGLFVLWLPILVMFSIVDRNPVSSERSAMLISRWMYNVNVVRTWAMEPNMRPSVESLEELEERWWTRHTDLVSEDPNLDSNANAIQPRTNNTANHTPARTSDPALSSFSIGKFVGQGRSLQYCGLVHAVLSNTNPDPDHQFHNDAMAYDNCGNAVANFLAEHKPKVWWEYALLSFCIVWVEIGMAVMLAWNTPTIGPGCWSGSCFLYGALSSITFFIQACTKRFEKWIEMLAYVFNGVAFIWLLATIVLQLTGVFNNCYCFSSPFGKPLGLGGYMDFGDSIEYRTNYEVIGYWIGAAAVGGVVPLAALVFAVGLWLGSSHLWNANEKRGDSIVMTPVYKRRAKVLPERPVDGVERAENENGAVPAEQRPVAGGSNAEGHQDEVYEYFRVGASTAWLTG